MLSPMRLHNSLSGQVEEVVPQTPGQILMYTCGPTVYRFAHLGNLRTFLLADVLRRALEFEGLDVTQIMNVTDVGHMTDESSAEAIDKMQLAAGDEGRSPAEIAQTYTEAFLEDAASIGIRPASRYPKATEHIPEMIAMTETLIANGHAYEAEGNIYYDVRSFAGYGQLSGNTITDLVAGHRDLEVAPGKRHHADFSLWKHAGTGRLQTWESPWGPGFPGWHIECSAMSMKYLGEHFDIHTGGNDLKFPHHEDEIAQSEGAVGHTVVNTWVHGGHLRLAGQKIAKSTGNVVRAPELAERGFDPLAFRYLTFQSRYRSEMDFSWEAMEVVDQKVRQLRRRVAEWGPAADSLDAASSEFDARFRETVARDLDLPQALVVLSDLVSTSQIEPAQKVALLASWDQVLGLDLFREAELAWEPTEQMRALMIRRDGARNEKDWASADALREELAGLGLEVMDTPDGTRVRPVD